MRYYSIIMLSIILISCNTSKELDIEEGVEKNVNMKETPTDTVDYENFIKKGNEIVAKVEYEKLFNQYKDSVKIYNVIQGQINRYSYEDPLTFRRKWNGQSRKTTSEGLIYVFTDYAKSGDKEAEAWLLDFFDRYIDEAIAWNNKYSDGPDGLPELYYKPMRGMMQVINRLPPSKEKIRLYQKLAGQETGPCHTYSEDVGCTYGDNLVFNGVRTNIADMTYRRNLLDEASDIRHQFGSADQWTTEKLPTLIEDILNDKIVMIDRETWKRR